MAEHSTKEKIKSFQKGEWKWVTLSILILLSILGLLAVGINGIISLF